MARAYRELDQVTAAKKLGIEPATLGRYEKGDIPEIKQAGLVERAAREFELPEEFFAVDFSRLPLMTALWKQAERLPQPGDLERLVDQAVSEILRGG